MDKMTEIARHIQNAEGQVCFIIGAGASKSAGIPLASELIERVCNEHEHCLNHIHKEQSQNYGKVMSALSPAERKKLFTDIIKKSKISWGQIALAALIKADHVSRVLTFNFDLVLERAVSLLGMQLPIYDFAESPTSNIKNIVSPSIVHLHGQSYGFVLLNTDEETKNHAEKIEPFLKIQYASISPL